MHIGKVGVNLAAEEEAQVASKITAHDHSRPARGQLQCELVAVHGAGSSEAIVSGEKCTLTSRGHETATRRTVWAIAVGGGGGGATLKSAPDQLRRGNATGWI